MTRNDHADVPQTAIRVDTYEELEEFAVKFSQGAFDVLAVVGNAGLRKSRTFRTILDAVEIPHLYVSGHTKPFVLYQELYHHRDQAIIIDDADSLFSDQAGIPLLKCLLETEMPKIVSWNSKSIDREEIPRSFTTNSRTIILCNQWRTTNLNMLAVEDRAIFLHFSPSVYEVHHKIGASEWFDDNIVHKFIETHLHLITEPSMRYYLKASAMHKAGIQDWETKTVAMLNPHSERFVILNRLLSDDSVTTEAERVARFVELTGCSKATFYRDRDLLLKSRGETVLM